MVALVDRDAVEAVAGALSMAMRRCRDLDGLEISFPQHDLNDVLYVALAGLTMLCRSEVLLDEDFNTPRPWPKCRGEVVRLHKDV